ncbi:MAG: hypothetical protein DDG59_06745 [Anaerolineae bacterium]|nr:MAG: hypothetical protein DDG59_06745 [Anaerolineae bacterium]
MPKRQGIPFLIQICFVSSEYIGKKYCNSLNRRKFITFVALDKKGMTGRDVLDFKSFRIR